MSSILQQTGPNPGDRSGGKHTMVIAVLRLAVGALFIATGVAKLFILSEFSNSVRQISPLAPSAATGIALIVIFLELLGGMGLVLKRQFRIAALLLLCLTGIFSYILMIEIISQHKFVCHCFGIIPISLSNSSELLLNVILLDLLTVLVLSQRQAAQETRKGLNWMLITLSAIFLYIQYTAAAYIIDRDVTDTSVNVQKINNFISNHYGAFNSDSNDRSHIVLIRISDFGCPPCFYDFVAYSQTVKQYYDSERDGNKVIGLVEQSGAITDTVSLNAWKNANDIPFPLLLVPEPIFKEFEFFKSCVVYQWPHGRIRTLYMFPGRESERRKLMSAFSQ